MPHLKIRLRRGAVFLALLVLALGLSMYLSKIAYSDVNLGDGEGGNNLLLDDDFQSYQMGEFPTNWSIESPGYGTSGMYVEELVFEPGNKVLHVMSASNKRAVVVHNLTPEFANISVCLSVKITEKKPFLEIDDPVALAVGLETTTGRKVPLVRLGRSDNQTVLPFNKWYSQDAWLPVCAWVNLEDGSTSVYIWQRLVGRTNVGNVTTEEIRSLYLMLGGGAWYEGRFDNIVVREYPIGELGWPWILGWTVLSAIRHVGRELQSSVRRVVHQVS